MMLGLMIACWSGEVVYPVGLEPFEENTAAWPEGEDFPETISLVSGDHEAGGAFAHGRGWIRAGIVEVREALFQPEVVVDRRRVDEWTSEVVASEEFDAVVQVHLVVHDVITVEFTNEWRHGVVDGKAGEAPEVAAGAWNKVDGSDLLRLLQGSFVLTAESESVTAFEVIEHLDATATGPEDVEGTLSDLYASVVAVAHGEPVPEWPAE